MNLRCLQNYIKEEYFSRDYSRGLYATFAWLVEEVGELANAILNNDRNNIEEEIADVIAWTLSIANLLGIDVVKAFTKKYGGSEICIENG